MAKVQAFSSVSVVDLTDVGSINLYCTSNQPLSVIYDPNTGGGTYSPNWSNSTLRITPVISYNGTNIAPTSQFANIVYTKKRPSEASASAISSSSGERNVNGVLEVSSNQLTATNADKQITYICTVTYTDPLTNIPVTTETSLTYTLMMQATQIRDIDIVGESVFLYKSDGSVVNDTITLTALATGTGITSYQWQYKNSNGNFVNFPTTNNPSTTTSTLIVKENEAGIWLSNDERYAVIKIATNDNAVYDTIQINKIHDGAAGDSVVSAILTNENFLLPVDNQGNSKIDAQTLGTAGASTIRIFEGGVDVTSEWSISTTPSGITGTFNNATFTPTGVTADVGYVTFTCTKSGYDDVVKRYSITKQYAGTDGAPAIVYSVEPNFYALNRNESGTLTPSSITFSAYKIESGIKQSYTGQLFIYEIDENTKPNYGSAKDHTNGSATSITYSPSSGAIVIRCDLFAPTANVSTDSPLDSQTVIVTKDGQTGASGQSGTDSISFGLGNYNDVIPCTTDGVATVNKVISIPFYAYKGITKIPVKTTLTNNDLPSANGDIEITLNQPATINSSTGLVTGGQLQILVHAGASFGDASKLTDNISIPLIASEDGTDATNIATSTQTYTWTKNIQAQNGQNAVLLQLYSEDGGNITTNKTSTTIKALLTSGTSTVSSGVTWAWYKFVSGSGYTLISGQTASQITINSSMVDDQMWLQCVATYNGNNYSAYYTIDDTTDPYMAYTFATIEQFKNVQGTSAIFTRVYQNGVEVDPIKTTTFSTTAPSNPSVGDYYYHMNSNGTCTLKKCTTADTWSDAGSSDNDELIYRYTALDSQGNPVTTGRFSNTITARCFCVKASEINGRMQFICEVTNATN